MNWTSGSNNGPISHGPKGIKRLNQGKGNWNYVRYADDFLLLTSGRKKEAEEMKDRVENFVKEELNLSFSDKKTSITHAEDGINFLGYHLEAADDPSGGVKRRIPRKAKEGIKSKVRTSTKGGTDVSVRAKIRALNNVLRGWANYYKYATNAWKTFNQMDHYNWWKVTDWLAEKYECSRNKLVERELTNSWPLRINDSTLIVMSGGSEIYTDTWEKGVHPYLESQGINREETPEEDPWLGLTEDRTGWRDVRQETLRRDNWTCQECGMDLTHQNAHVHHKRLRSGYENKEEADRLENLTSLCESCHLEMKSNRHIA